MSDALYYDVLVIGSGIAGGTLAWRAAQLGFKVALVTRGKGERENNTYHAQGGIVALGEDDSPELLYQDIMRAGAGINNPEAVQVISTEGPKIVEEFLVKTLKVPFAREGEKFLYGREAAHSRRRILFVGDRTGKAIMEALWKALDNSPNIDIFTHHTAVDLITNTHHAEDPLEAYKKPRSLGAYVLDNRIGKVKRFFAKFTALATGGLGRIYLHTSNPEGARGDGYAMASRAGARLLHMEFIQFHPTSLFHRDADGFLISEAVRGEGAKLLTRDGQPFLQKYTPQGELAPRDVVARAIYEELHRRGDNYVLLDLSSLKINIPERFPEIYRKCRELGIDITRQPIPVVPAAHYSIGGVLVDTRGRTSLDGLYAVGEVSCTGVHGANRLASTSLLEGLTWGWRAAEDMANLQVEELPFHKIPPWKRPKNEMEVDPALIVQDWVFIKHTMWNYAGIIRTERRLQRAISDLRYLYHRIESFYRTARVNDAIIGLRNGIIVAQEVVKAALMNRRSIGAHYWREENGEI